MPEENNIELGNLGPAMDASPDEVRRVLFTHRHTGADRTKELVGINDPTSVGDGGTGANSFTNGGILLGSGTDAITAMPILADGEIVVGDGATDPVALDAFTSSTGTLKHEQGGVETDISAVAKGGLVGGSGTGSMALLPVGSNNQVLTAASGESTGMKWATPSATPPTKEFFVPITSDSGPAFPYTVIFGNVWPLRIAGNLVVVHFTFYIPLDFSSLTDLKLVMIPDTTETVQIDGISRYAAVGQDNETHSDSLNNQTVSAVGDQLTELDLSGLLASVGAGDYVGLRITSNTVELRILGLRVKYS